MACISAISGLISGGIQGIGSLFTADQAKQAALDAGNIESKGALDAAQTQAAGLTKGAQTEASGVQSGADVTAKGLLQGGQTAANAALTGGRTAANAMLTGGQTAAGAMLGGGQTAANAMLYGGQTTSNALLAGGKTAAAGYDTAINGATGQFGVTKNALNPYLQTGAVGANLAANLLGGSNGDPAKMQAALAQTPGYQFALTQGLKATQAGFAAKGLGSSGAALRGAADYTTGLASQTYGMIFNQAMAAENTGEAAATTLSSANQDFMQLISGLQTGKSTILGESQAAAGSVLGAARTGAGQLLGTAETGAGQLLGTAQTGAGGLLGASQTSAGNILGSAQAGSAAARGTALSTIGQILGGGQAGSAATLAAGQLGSANALAAGKIGSANALTAGLNSMFSAFGNSALLVGNSGLFKSPANSNSLGAGTNYVGGVA